MKETFRFTGAATINGDIYGRGWTPEQEPIHSHSKILMSAICRIPILNFDLTGLKGKNIQHAALYLKVEGEECPTDTDVTSISHPWNSRYATLVYADQGVKWVHDKWFTDVVMGGGNSVHKVVNIDYDDRTGTARLDIPVDLIYAMVNEQSFGFGLIDGKSRQYTEEKWGQIIKQFNVNEENGLVPQLEIEYSDGDYLKPQGALSLETSALKNDDSFEYASVKLKWSIPNDGASEYRYFNLYVSEKDAPLKNMRKIQKFFVPNYVAGQEFFDAKIDYLKPNTDYVFAVTVCNNEWESEPIFKKVRTLEVLKRPEVEADDPEAGLFDGNPAVENELFSIHVLDEIIKANPVNGNLYDLDPGAYTSMDISNLNEYRNYYFDGKTIRLQGVPGERMAFQLLVENKTGNPENYDVKIAKSDLKDRYITVNRVWYLNCDDAWIPEAAVPMADPRTFAIPAPDNAIPGQRFQALFVDLEIPGDQKAGICCFNMEISTRDKTASLPVEVTVADVKLQKADFKFELNGYTPVPHYMNAKYGEPEYENIEKAYYQTAFEHDCMINIVPYSQYGRVSPGFAPRIEFVDGIPRVVDWSEWDAHFGKYLDGTYLEEKTGRKIPITHMYLPIHENWPMGLNEHFKIKVESQDYPQMVNEQKIKSTTMENDFTPEYREGIKSIIKDFIRHFDEKGWQNIEFQYFFNNKHYFKRKDGTFGYGGGICWWLLDEPVFPDDFKALAFYAEILREAQKEMNSGYNIRFRIDISRYHHIFDYLDGKLDISVLSRMAMQYRLDQARERKQRFGEDYWVYGGLSNIKSSSMSLCLWIVDAYLDGAEGILPWNNYGRDEHYEKPESTAGLYPGTRFGLKSPVVSLRLKAVRRGMELLKYLRAFKNAYGYNDLQLREYIAHFLDFKSHIEMYHSEDAGRVQYALTGDWNIERLKRHILDKLSKA
jgi:hypothetical protein